MTGLGLGLRVAVNLLNSNESDVITSEAEVRSLLELGGDVWTFDEDQYEDTVGLFNGRAFGNNAPKDPSPLLGQASITINDDITGDFNTFPELFNGTNFYWVFWVKTAVNVATPGPQADLFLATCGEYGDYTVLGIQIDTSLNKLVFTFGNIAGSTQVGMLNIPDQTGETWYPIFVMRIGTDYFFSAGNQVENNSNVSHEGGMDFTAETNHFISMRGTQVGADSISVSFDQMLVLPTADVETDVYSWWINGGAGRTLTPL